MSSKILKVVIASPSDVQEERDTAERVVQDINAGVALDRGLRLEVKRWETDAYPGFHEMGPQGLIDDILDIESSDILIGVFWKRFGSPTHESGSGTEHEIMQAYEGWKKSGKPAIMLYFKEEAYIPTTTEETDQQGKVIEFKKALPKESLWWTYDSATEFSDLLRRHLVKYLRQKYPLINSVVSETLITHNTKTQKRIRWLSLMECAPANQKTLVEYIKTFEDEAKQTWDIEYEDYGVLWGPPDNFLLFHGPDLESCAEFVSALRREFRSILSKIDSRIVFPTKYWTQDDGLTFERNNQLVLLKCAPDKVERVYDALVRCAEDESKYNIEGYDIVTVGIATGRSDVFFIASCDSVQNYRNFVEVHLHSTILQKGWLVENTTSLPISR